VASTNVYHCCTDEALLHQRPLPKVRYQDEKANNCEVANHRNNIDGGWQPEEKEEKEPSENKEGDGGNPDDPSDNDDEGQVMVERFEEDFSKCRRNMYCVGLAQASSGPSPYIFVGKITSVDKDARTFCMKELKCTKDPWKQECMAAPWHPGTDPVTTKPHYAVMAYLPKLNQGGKLTKAAKEAVEERRHIEWHS
jgi:hypothetical protein